MCSGRSFSRTRLRNKPLLFRFDTGYSYFCNFEFCNFEMPAKGYKFSFSPNYVKVHYFHYVLTFFSPINLKYIDIESAIKCYVTNVPRHCVVCQSVGSSFVCPFLRCACKLGLAFFRINNSEFIFSREELPMRPMAYVLCIHLN